MLSFPLGQEEAAHDPFVGVEDVAVRVVRFEGAAVVFVKGEGAAISGDVGIAVVDANGKGGVPAKAQGAVHRAFEVAGLAVAPLHDAVAAIAAFPHHRHATRRHPQVRLPVVVRPRRVEDVMGVGEVREEKEYKTENGRLESFHGLLASCVVYICIK